MGLMDRVKAMFGEAAEAEDAPVEELPLDVEVRRAQLDELEDAVRSLARAMAAKTDLMANPGWRGRVEDLRFAANEAAQLSRSGFDRAALHDVAAEVRPLYGPGEVPAEYAPFRAEHERVLAAVDALRGSLPSESS
ncbi:MAG TPA: hypothetical protein VK925_05985 [Jiangellaceae bacterium]|nr:hypothetical protein [Jiangellaceae bacterium]